MAAHLSVDELFDGLADDVVAEVRAHGLGDAPPPLFLTTLNSWMPDSVFVAATRVARRRYWMGRAALRTAMQPPTG